MVAKFVVGLHFTLPITYTHKEATLIYKFLIRQLVVRVWCIYALEVIIVVILILSHLILDSSFLLCCSITKFMTNHINRGIIIHT